MSWALSYLEKIDLVESDSHDCWSITSLGRAYCKAGGEDHKRDGISVLLQAVSGFDCPEQETGRGEEEKLPEISEISSKITDSFEALFQQSYQQLKDRLIRRIHGQSPKYFEKLIIDLLVAMGYGNGRHDIRRHLGRSGDGGIDGAINQDQLGLDVVYVQAKRFRPDLYVPVSAVRDFAGALEAHKARKGVFVTTARFTKPGREFVDAVSHRIVLVDGNRLASLLIRNKIAVKTVETYEIREIDESYFS